jgi:hypothetical protein
VLAVAMPTTDFGPVAPSAPATLPFTVGNSGNAAAAVSVSVTGAGFTVSAPSTVAASSNAPGKVTFTTQPPYGAAPGTLTVTTSTNLCQPQPPAPVSMTATKVGPVASPDVSALTFAVECANAAAPVSTVTITNKGTAPLTLSSPTVSPGFSVAGYTSTAIQPGKAGTITVQASTTPASGEKAGSVRSGTLGYKTDEYGTPSYTASLSATLHGADLGFYSDAAHTSSITSDTIICDEAAPLGPDTPWWQCSYYGLDYYIFNGGDEPVTVGTANGSPAFSDPTHMQIYFRAQTALPLVVGPGAVTVATYPNIDFSNAPPACPTGATQTMEWLQYAVSGNVCVPLPKMTVPVVGLGACP